jgi:hypothetical protein
MTHTRAYYKRGPQAREKRQQQAQQRRLEQARAPLQGEQARAQRHLHALEQAMVDWGLPATGAAELEWRLQNMGTLLGNIVGLMFPTWFGCQTTSELTRVRLWDKHLPSKLRGALPQRKGVRHLQRMGQALLVQVGRYLDDNRPATRSRGPWPWAADDRVFKPSGTQLSVGGRWWSGQEHRGRLGGGHRRREAGRPGGLRGAPPCGGGVGRCRRPWGWPSAGLETRR